MFKKYKNNIDTNDNPNNFNNVLSSYEELKPQQFLQQQSEHVQLLPEQQNLQQQYELQNQPIYEVNDYTPVKNQNKDIQNSGSDSQKQLQQQYYKVQDNIDMQSTGMVETRKKQQQQKQLQNNSSKGYVRGFSSVLSNSRGGGGLMIEHDQEYDSMNEDKIQSCVQTPQGLGRIDVFNKNNIKFQQQQPQINNFQNNNMSIYDEVEKGEGARNQIKCQYQAQMEQYFSANKTQKLNNDYEDIEQEPVVVSDSNISEIESVDQFLKQSRKKPMKQWDESKLWVQNDDFIIPVRDKSDPKNVVVDEINGDQYSVLLSLFKSLDQSGQGFLKDTDFVYSSNLPPNLLLDCKEIVEYGLDRKDKIYFQDFLSVSSIIQKISQILQQTRSHLQSLDNLNTHINETDGEY